MADSQFILEIDGASVPLRVRHNTRARRLILRLDEQNGGAVVTLPPGIAIDDGVAMARRQSAWLAAQLKRCPERRPFVPGACVPFLGVDHVIRHHEQGHGVQREGGEIRVAGRPEHLARRVTDWLKLQARHELAARAVDKAARLADLVAEGSAVRIRRPGRVSVRDTRSRWGSCAADGGLNFSWRLIMAPEYVLDYVVAHEVAHLVHRNHGEAFWALTARLTARMEAAKTWLRTHGRTLYFYG